MLSADRYFDPDPAQRKIARDLYEHTAALPLICPHGHVDPRTFADPNYSFGTPTELFIIPDHYIFRMLYSQGIAMEELGVPTANPLPALASPTNPLAANPSPPTPLPKGEGSKEEIHRKIWQTFAENFYLFRGTPTGIWIAEALVSIFGIQEKLNGGSGQRIYDQIAAKLATPEFRPRALYDTFNIEVLCTTDAAIDPLDSHRAIRVSGWKGDIRPTFRPDNVLNLDASNWKGNIETLSRVSGVKVHDYPSFIQALEQRRAFFKEMGATATDHAAVTPFTEDLTDAYAEEIFQRALHGKGDEQDATRFTGHMLIEMARMSVEDGLVMQLHPGSLRNHNQAVYEKFGADKGADIPLATEYTRNMKPLLNKFGNDPRLTLILFTLDEATHSRELAPLAGHYPAVKLGPPWWFYDSLNGFHHFFDTVIETAGLYNTVGFNDDTRAFASIPVRHDVWRRAAADWLAGQVVRHIVDEADAVEMMRDMAYGLAKRAYKFES
jgi:glucuronate isomerase